MISMKSILIILSFYSCSLFAQPAIISHRDIFTPVVATNGMVVTASPLASKAGVEVLKKGGNAVDAAVTVGLVMAVTYPRAGNIGGGGFMLIDSVKSAGVVSIDYREKAPEKSFRDMFLDQSGNPDYRLSQFSHRSVGVPGTLAGFALALEKYGTISLAEALKPAIKLAEEGFVVSVDFFKDIQRRAKRLKSWPATQAVFFKKGGGLYQVGERFFQKDLANTLRQVAKQGISAFYQGKIADLLVKDMQANQGLMTKTDLQKYKAVLRKPIQGKYRGYDVYSMAPPSSGGIHIVQMLNMLEAYNLNELGHNSAATIHLLTEVMKRAYADRSKHLGDPDFSTVEDQWLTSKAYAKQLVTSINSEKITPSEQISPSLVPSYESDQTTHFSIVDKEGSVVSNTYTLNFSYGTGRIAKGTGILLNNEMDDFSIKPGVPNAYGLIGGALNAVEPYKRMLSSMSPTIVKKNGQPVIVTGSPGGSRIITTTLQVILNIIDHRMNLQEAVNAVRIHHQWLPDKLRIEEGLSLDTLNVLKLMGYNPVNSNTMGATASILIDYQKNLKIFHGASDPRRSGLAVGY
ncbi:MAG: gamma-glutamyltransferase [Methylococcales bacterium]|jgi:gamma-glutamyltranspeptidase / glutathione hydrolase|nr:gamma-glutamyltransferase [Methylococcales bacterium]MBT7408657.1 gamma-glutamyltransferase [Methylococcales bacterium]